MTALKTTCEHHCILATRDEVISPSFFTRILDAYLEKVQNFSQLLFEKGWTVSSMIVPAFFGEPLETFSSIFRRICGWKSQWEKHGFYDAMDPQSLEKLRKDLETAKKILTPVLLFHGLFSTPDMWLPWAPTIRKAVQDGEIGYVIGAQLPNNLEERMVVVRKIIEDVVRIYREVKGPEQVDIIGHSKGGYAGHLAYFKKAEIIDEHGVERRWHYLEQNPLVRKVISVAAPTWLCCHGQADTTRQLKDQDIYPLKLVNGAKSIEESYTTEQLEEIRENHPDIYDIIGTQDAISPIDSPLPKEQIIYAKHGHMGVVTCPKVCRATLLILAAAA